MPRRGKENVEQCVRLAREVLDDHGISGEVLVVDNGSTDGSGELARRAGARVVEEPRRGYGNAYMAGFAASQGEYIVMADADLTYDFHEIPRFLAELEGGADLVMGDRFQKIHPGAMPWLNQLTAPVSHRLAQPNLRRRGQRRLLRDARHSPRGLPQLGLRG